MDILVFALCLIPDPKEKFWLKLIPGYPKSDLSYEGVATEALTKKTDLRIEYGTDIQRGAETKNPIAPETRQKPGAFKIP